MANTAHLDLLRSGPEHWNARRSTTEELSRADFRGADLHRANLRGANLSQADLTEADLGKAKIVDADLSGSILRGADLEGALIYGADLSGADLTGARLKGANLSRADLTRASLKAADLSGTDLSGANLSGADLTEANMNAADLTGAALVGTNLERANLDGCRVYAASVWNVRLDGASQTGLRITSSLDQLSITVDNLEVAQFVYLLLNNAKLRSVIDTVTARTVLLLGRFTPERKVVLDAMHQELRQSGYLPILFDFAGSSNRSITETVLILAGMSRFVIADLTDAASVPQELSAIAFSPLTNVPVQPIIMRGSPEWSMYVDLDLKGRFLAPFIYESVEDLLTSLAQHVIAPADREVSIRRTEMDRRRAEAALRRTGE